MRTKAILGLLLAVALGGAALTAAAVPLLMDFQARLADDDNLPVSGTFEITFTLWDAATEGDVVWQELHEGVEVRDGWLLVTLGSIDPHGYPLSAAINGGQPLWLGVALDGGPELAPRQALNSVPRAFRADMAEGVALGGVDDESLDLGTITFDKLAQTCAEGQVLVMTGGGWACGEYQGQRVPD